MFVNTMMGGVNSGFPDTCNTPAAAGAPVPIPYPNIALGPTSNPATAALKVLAVGTPSLNMFTTGTISNGDEAGVMMGVASAMIMGPNKYLLGSLKVFKGGAPAQRLTSLGAQNGFSPNVPGVTLAPSQVKVLVLG